MSAGRVASRPGLRVVEPAARSGRSLRAGLSARNLRYPPISLLRSAIASAARFAHRRVLLACRRFAQRSSRPAPHSPSRGCAGMRASPRSSRPVHPAALASVPAFAAHRLATTPAHRSPHFVRALGAELRPSLRAAAPRRALAVRTSAGTTVAASGSVLRTTARGSVRTVPATQSPWRLPSAGFAGVDSPIAPAARLAVLTARGGLESPHPTHLRCRLRRAAFAPTPMPLRMILRTPGAACRAGNRATNLVVSRIETNLLISLSLSAVGPKACLPCNTPSGERYQIGGAHTCAPL